MKFKKMHGCGNDYIVVDGIKNDINLTKEEISFLCTPHFGIGSEGLLVVLPSKIADFRMRMFNVDGTEAEMCGNGIRCISKFAFDENIISKKTATVETKSGIKSVELVFDVNNFLNVKVNMGKAEFFNNPTSEYDLHCVSIGNPHAIMIVDNLDDFPVVEFGPKIEQHEGFPNRTNVEFVKIIDKNTINLRVWERGCAETYSCGTGSCAAVAALNKLGLVNADCLVRLKGGYLKIDIINDEIFMTGNAVNVFNGDI
jgi:diaminopimelate epimerase